MTINKNNISHFFYLQKIDNSILIEKYVEKDENDIFRHKSSNLAY